MLFKASRHRNLSTQRLRLTAPSLLDVADVFEFCSDPASCRYADWSPHSTKADTREYISWLKRKAGETSFTWAMRLKEDDKVIGTISLVETDYSGKIATVGYTLSAKYQHKGYATEALNVLLDYLFDEVGCERVQAKVMIENTPSIRLLERVGMIREARLVKGAFCRTACVDVYLYAKVKK